MEILRSKLIIYIAVAGLICFIVTAFFIRLKQSEAEVEPETISVKQTNTVRDEVFIYVDISGSIKKPGLYKLSTGTRMNEVIQKAGGFVPEASTTWIAQSLNLAQILQDQEKIYIPHESEDTAVIQGNSYEAKSTTSLVNVNVSSSEQLEALNGVGMATAKKIIENRPYSSPQDLLDKKVVSKNLYEKLLPFITIH